MRIVKYNGYNIILLFWYYLIDALLYSQYFNCHDEMSYLTMPTIQDVRSDLFNLPTSRFERFKYFANAEKLRWNELSLLWSSEGAVLKSD